MTAYYDLGAYSRLVTTKSPEAQVWFDRGLNWLFGLAILSVVAISQFAAVVKVRHAVVALVQLARRASTRQTCFVPGARLL